MTRWLITMTLCSASVAGGSGGIRSYVQVVLAMCDVPLGDHLAQYNMHAKLRPGEANPFVDPANCTLEADIEEATYGATLDAQK